MCKNLCVILQADCAAAGAATGQCAACGGAADSASFHPLADSSKTDALARKLGLQSVETIMKNASTALNLLAYQAELVNAKKRQNDKAQLKKITNQSKDKIRELHAAAQKACSSFALRVRSPDLDPAVQA
jgi:hypothetical protein